MQETIQQAKAGDPFQDVTDSDVADARPDEMFLDGCSDDSFAIHCFSAFL